MININEIREYVYNILSKYAEVYYKEAERNADGSVDIDKYFIVYEIEDIMDNYEIRERSDFTLNIDIWFDNDYMIDVERMTYEINRELYRSVNLMKSGAFRVDRNINYEINIPEDQVKKSRKRLRYVVKYYNY